MESSDEELLCESTKWEKKLLDSDQNNVFFQTCVESDSSDLPDSKYLKVLFKKFGHKKFRPLQWKIIKSLLIDKNDNCAIMSTGYGKSLCYQFPAVYSNGVAIVISPLISLMEDQILSLNMKNIPSCLLGSAQKNNYYTIEEILTNKYKLIYVTPEFCTGDCGLDLFKSMRSKLQITLIAIDEAHCVSSWGHDFRPSYKALGVLKDIFFDIPILALTATATEVVKKDIVNTLNLKDPQIICSGYDRPNLYLSVRPKSGNILADLKSVMIRKNSRWVFEGPTIIYCIRRKDTEEISNLLKIIDIASVAYHAGMSLKGRKETHESFIKDKVSVIVATIAFGMGIDKPDIRNVIHYGAPKSIESYYQEAGRAGRDGLPSKCVAFYGNHDFNTQTFLINQGKNIKQNMQVLDTIKEYLQSSKCRRQFILSYFSDSNSPQTYECCDNCSQQNVISDTKLYEKLDGKGMYDFTEDSVKFLSAVQAMNGKFGIMLYVLFLKGSKNSRLHQRFRQHSCYGSGNDKSEDWWKAIANFLQLKNLLKKSLFKRNSPGFIVDITEKGQTFLRQTGHGQKLIEQPSKEILKFLKKKQHASGWVSANGSNSSHTTELLPSNSQTGSSEISITEKYTSPNSLEVTEGILKLFRLLKNSRTRLAADNNCMPYMIASDFVLMEIAKKRPCELQQLRNMQVEGLIDAVIDKFGADFIKVINDTIDKDKSFSCKELTENPKASIFDILLNHPIESLKPNESVITTYSFFKKGRTLEEIASVRNLKYSTVVDHLIVLMKLGYPIKMELLEIDLRVRCIIIQVVNNLGGNWSAHKSIKNECPENITYDQIKVVCTYLQVRTHLEQIGMPYEEFEDFIYKENMTSGDLYNEQTNNDDNSDLLRALCDAMGNEVSHKMNTPNFNQTDVSNPGNTFSSDLNNSEPPSKKIRVEANDVLSSPPTDFSKDVTRVELDANIALSSPPREFFDRRLEVKSPVKANISATVELPMIMGDKHKETQNEIQQYKHEVIEISLQTKRKLPQWLSKKQKP